MVSRAVLLAFRDSIRWEPVYPNGDATREPRAWVFTADVNCKQVTTRVYAKGRIGFWLGDGPRFADTLSLAQAAVEAWWLKQLEVP